jgi:hypothetical protein
VICSVELCTTLVVGWPAVVEMYKEVVTAVSCSVELCPTLVLGWAPVV